MRRYVRYAAQLLASSVVIALIAGAIALASTTKSRTGRWQLPSKQDVDALATQLRLKAPRPARYIHLVRSEMQVWSGPDDATSRHSSLLPSNTYAMIPAYKSTPQKWNQLVRCVQEKFADYDVVISDEEPPAGVDSVLVKVGGRPGDIGLPGGIGGVAPFNGHPLPNSIVFVFDAGGNRRTATNCETAAHEIGHVFGLDHSMDCGDLMSYQRCGTKTFTGSASPCGEREVRPCELGAVQNSHEHLLRLLGPMPKA